MRERNPGALYGKALDRFTRAQNELVRVFHRYEKARAELRRREKILDKCQTIDEEAKT